MRRLLDNMVSGNTVSGRRTRHRLMIVSALIAVLMASAWCQVRRPDTNDTDEKAPGYKYEVLSGMPSASRIKTIGTGIPDIIIEASPSPSSPGIGRDEGEGREVWTCTDENAISGNIVMSADGRWVAIGYTLNDLRLEVRNGEDGDLVFSYPVEYGASKVAMTADGDQIGYAALDSVWQFRLMGEGVPFFRVGLDGYGPGPIGLTRNGEYLVVTGNDPDHERNRVWCFRNAQPDPVWTFEVPEEDVFAWYGLSIARDNSVVVVNGKYHLYVLDLETGERLWDRPTYNTESSIALSGDASVLCVSSLSGMLTTYVREMNGDGYREIWRYRFSGGIASWVTTCRVSIDGRTIAAGTLDFYEDRYEGRLALFETYGDGEPVWVCEPLGDEVSDVAMSDDGNIIAASSWGDIDNQRPDLVVHERFSSEPFFTLSTPGSMRGIAISDDGGKVVVGGKAVHSRVFGRGGRVVMVSLNITGGHISGTVIDSDDERLEGAVVTASDNPYSATTDRDGEYNLGVEVSDSREVTVVAHLPGYMDRVRRNVRVTANRTTEDIDFRLEALGPPPENVSASQGERNRITVVWDPYNDDGFFREGRYTQLTRSAVGDDIIFTGPTPWTTVRKPERDHNEEAERINIYRSHLVGGPYYLIGSVDGDDTQYHDREGIIPDRRYYYVVTADFGNGESAYSDEATGWLDDSFLIWEADLDPMVRAVHIDGRIEDQEWEGSVVRDISDIYGFDDPDSAGSVEVRIGFNDDSDHLLLGFSYYVVEELQDRMGVGVYVDDDGNGKWTRERSGSEGNYWGYWIDGAPEMTYRSLSGSPYNVDPYYVFEDPELAFGNDQGYVEIEMAIPLGFHGTEEVGLYAPDYSIGLGLFAMQRDDEGGAIFNGWWPQDMFSIVSFPEQFAGVRIPADLVVPPCAPEDVALERGLDRLILTWDDPDMGIDGGAMDDLAGINIYRNGEFQVMKDPGVERFADVDVIRGGWYEYSPTGFVLDGDEQFEGTGSIPVGMYSGFEPEISRVIYDDGSAEQMYVVAFEGDDNRFGVCFDLDDLGDTLAVYQVDFFAGSIAPIELYIASDVDGRPGEMIGNRYLTQPRAVNRFHRFHFPGVDQPVIAAIPDWFNCCWVVLNYLADSPAAPSIGVDYSQPDPSRNLYYTEDGGWRELRSGQLMVRIGVGLPSSNIPITVVSGYPCEFRLHQNYPNPFNSRCVIPVELPFRSQVALELFDINGRLILSHSLSANRGFRHLPLFAPGLGSGIYFVRITSGEDRGMIKVSLIR